MTIARTSAAALRSLKRTGQYNMRPVGPFASEGASFLQLHHELLSCAQRTFTVGIRGTQGQRGRRLAQHAPIVLPERSEVQNRCSGTVGRAPELSRAALSQLPEQDSNLPPTS